MWLPTVPVSQSTPKFIGNSNYNKNHIKKSHPLVVTKKKVHYKPKAFVLNHLINEYNARLVKSSSSSSSSRLRKFVSCCPVLTTITILMNDFRLKLLYRTTKTTSTTKPKTTPTQAPYTRKQKKSSDKATTTTFTLANLPTLGTKKTLAGTGTSNNNPRTYNNSSKSNKVFLHYIPRDPRLRIFNKTAIFNKHFGHRTLSELNITEDLCNYGELIGGSEKQSKNLKFNSTKLTKRELKYLSKPKLELQKC